MKHLSGVLRLIPITFLLTPLSAQDPAPSRQIQLPSSKVLQSPSPGRIGPVNSFPATIAVNPDGQYAALLNMGYGTQKSQARQSITILDLKSNQLSDFPDARLAESAHQSYFIGLAFSPDGRRLYASMGSFTDPVGAKPENTGNGIAVYKFEAGKVSPERFLKIAPQARAPVLKVDYDVRKPAAVTAIPSPAGRAVIAVRTMTGFWWPTIFLTTRCCWTPRTAASCTNLTSAPMRSFRLRFPIRW